MIPANLASCPIEIAGEWPDAPAEAAHAVVTRVREVCLTGINLWSDDQPNALKIENRLSGRPAIWLHDQPAQTAWIKTNVGPRDWCKLAYQVGHELGHVLCNSWRLGALPQPPCQWLEEALVEAFSVRGLELLAESWAEHPLFPGDEGFAAVVRKYKDDILAKDEELASQHGTTDLRRWFAKKSAELDKETGLGLEQAALPVVLGLIKPQPTLIADYGALNRWPERSALPLPEYLCCWKDSCKQVGASGTLPALLGDMLLEAT